VKVGVSGDSGNDAFDVPRWCLDGVVGAVFTAKYPVSSSCGFRRRDGEFRYAGRRGESISGRCENDIALREK
jgi:hypothetical protein